MNYYKLSAYIDLPYASWQYGTSERKICLGKRYPREKHQYQYPYNFHPEITESTPTYYSNFVQVSHTPYEFSLTFAKIPSPPNVDQIAMAQAGKPVKIESLMQIAIPVKLIPGLLEALLNQKELYEKNDKKVNQPKQNRS